MLIKNIIAVFCIAFILYSCKDKKLTCEVIKINPFDAKEEINLSEFVDSIKLIRLQTDSNCVMGRIKEIIIKEKYIYALDVSQGIVFVFDKKGKYIAKLDKRGKGPDEYLYIGPIFIPENEEFIKIINFKGKETKLQTYSNITFNLLEKSSMPRISANSCKNENGTYYFATQQIENTFNGKSTNASILAVKNGKIERKIFDKNIITQHTSFSPNNECFTKNDKGELFVSIMYDNTFYELRDMNAKPILNVDFGKFGINNSIGFKSIEEQQKYLKSANGLATFPVLNVFNSNILAFSYSLQENKDRLSLYQYIKIIKINKTFHTKKITNDITSFPDKVYLSTYHCGISHEVWYKDYLVDIVQPSYYFSDGDTKYTIEGLGGITAEDNPIIVLLKIKGELK